jgi:MFS transporter, putative metabolite:H+ symporter
MIGLASLGQAPGVPALTTGGISARLDRLPATRSVWRLVVLLGLGLFFEIFDLILSGYVAPGLVKSGILTPTTPGLFGTTGMAGFIAALFSGMFLATLACGFLADRFGRRAILPTRCCGIPRATCSWPARRRRRGWRSGGLRADWASGLRS